ncbi:MAG: AraC family transcriptional regulator [Bacteroidales bacterium]|nr:AraC family transcriptional regulator [Bacteroidales bacterium]MCL2133103.1 AraC family transcriptional regulator [Bacteroidales bacterium]
MKPVLRRFTTNPQYSFHVRKDVGANVYSMWHHHPELELLVIRGGKGVHTIGDKTDTLNETSHLMFIGPYLPHTMSYDSKSGAKPVEAIVVHFSENLFGKKFMELPEAKLLIDLIAKSAYGIELIGNDTMKLEQQMFELFEADLQDRLFILIDILHRLARSNYTLVASQGFVGNYSQKENKRIDKIYQFTFDNFHRDINLDETASSVNLSKEAFCRYFKQKTGKTYVQFLTEVRIGNACKLLMQNDMTVLEVCYACGYNYPSNFYRQFKAIKKVTPLEYQKSYLSLPSRK